MANYIQIDNDTWIKYNPVTATSVVLKKSELLEMRSRHEELLSGEALDDAQLLQWAKQNYPTPELAQRFVAARRSIELLDSDLVNMNGD